MTENVIAAESLSVTINDRVILSRLNFQVAKGEVFALLGGNGAGKSTALKTFLGLLAPAAGEACILGMPVHKNITALRRKMAYLPESVMLYGHLTAVENIRYFLSLAGISRGDNEIDRALERVSLQADARTDKLGQYSKGMRQKTAIALALLREAPVLLLDEPTSGLDPGAIDEFNGLVRQLSGEGATVFMVTHDVYGACQVADRIGLLRDGALVGTYNSPEAGRIDTEVVHSAFARGQST